jgi:uncharacterized coiled-coil protein SlyX
MTHEEYSNQIISLGIMALKQEITMTEYNKMIAELKGQN